MKNRFILPIALIATVISLALFAQLRSAAASGSWTAQNPMSTARFMHTATLLPNGRVLVAGGCDAFNFFASSEVFDPATGNPV